MTLPSLKSELRERAKHELCRAIVKDTYRLLISRACQRDAKTPNYTSMAEFGRSRATVLLGLLVVAATSVVPTQAQTVRTAFIAAEKIEWDYAPWKLDFCSGLQWTSESVVFGKQGIGTSFYKAVYRGYSDSSFNVSLQCGSVDPHSAFRRTVKISCER